MVHDLNFAFIWIHCHINGVTIRSRGDGKNVSSHGSEQPILKDTFWTEVIDGWAFDYELVASILRRIVDMKELRRGSHYADGGVVVVDSDEGPSLEY